MAQPAAQPAAQSAPSAAGGHGKRSAPAPIINSAEVLPDRQVTFRIYAPQAANVKFQSDDINYRTMGNAWSRQMEKGGNGVWETTVGPLDPGAYRYRFMVAGVLVADPKNPEASESASCASSLVVVPGSEFMDTKDVPHGAVAQITYYSKSLGKFRRMHIYTPPGYEKNGKEYPTLYLLHGLGDSDDCWPTVGRAGFILDNMIAAGKVRPMVVVMPALYPPYLGASVPQSAGQHDGSFTDDFLNDIMPYVESHYRVYTDRSHRAMAGLSMGAKTTHQIVMAHLDKFSCMGLFSGGHLGGFINTNEITNLPAFKKTMKVVFMSCGERENPAELQASHDALEKIGMQSTVFIQPDADHEWRVWRPSLVLFAPLLFQN